MGNWGLLHPTYRGPITPFMTGRKVKNILPNGGAKWWFAMVESIKTPPTQQIHDKIQGWLFVG